MKDLKYVENNIKKCASLDEIDDKELIDFQNGYAYIVAVNSKKLKPTQLRKFFNALKKMQQKKEWKEIETEFYLLKPRMAVASGRKNIPKPFFNLMMVMMSKIDNVENDDEVGTLKMKNFNKFVKFFEAVVAYHKYKYPSVR